jgi:hypothetical protein
MGYSGAGGVYRHPSRTFWAIMAEAGVGVMRLLVASDEDALRRELAKEKFVVSRMPESPFSFTARYTANELVCGASWDIHWSVFAGKIETIGASFSEICL